MTNRQLGGNPKLKLTKPSLKASFLSSIQVKAHRGLAHLEQRRQNRRQRQRQDLLRQEGGLLCRLGRERSADRRAQGQRHGERQDADGRRPQGKRQLGRLFALHRELLAHCWRR